MVLQLNWSLPLGTLLKMHVRGTFPITDRFTPQIASEGTWVIRLPFSLCFLSCSCFFSLSSGCEAVFSSRLIPRPGIFFFFWHLARLFVWSFALFLSRDEAFSVLFLCKVALGNFCASFISFWVALCLFLLLLKDLRWAFPLVSVDVRAFFFLFCPPVLTQSV